MDEIQFLQLYEHVIITKNNWIHILYYGIIKKKTFSLCDKNPSNSNSSKSFDLSLFY